MSAQVWSYLDLIDTHLDLELYCVNKKHIERNFVQNRPPLKALVTYSIPNETVYMQQSNQLCRVSLDEFAKQLKVSVKHGIFYDPKDQELVDALRAKNRTSCNDDALKDFLDNPKTYFAVSYINTTCGWGLRAVVDIPPATVVGIYSGELTFKQSGSVETESLEDRAYDMSALKDVTLNNTVFDVLIRASYYGDATRFASHLPTNIECYSLKLDSTISIDNILTANMTFPMGYANGIPVCMYLTTHAIKQGEFAGIYYGDGYWKNRGQPCLLVKDNSTDIKIAYYDKSQKVHKCSSELISAKLNVVEEGESKDAGEVKVARDFSLRSSMLPLSFLKSLKKSNAADACVAEVAATPLSFSKP